MPRIVPIRVAPVAGSLAWLNYHLQRRWDKSQTRTVWCNIENNNEKYNLAIRKDFCNSNRWFMRIERPDGREIRFEENNLTVKEAKLYVLKELAKILPGAVVL